MKKKIALAAVALALVATFITTAALAQQKRAMTFEDVLALKTVGDAQISPDGRWIVYTVTTANVKESNTDADVWMVATAGGPPVRLTTSKKNDNSPRWSPDGRWIAFISAREDKPQVFLISPTGGEAERLTESKSGVQSFQWSPDSRSIAYVAQQVPTPDEERRQKEKEDWIVVDKNFKFSRLWVIDIGSKKATELVASDYVVNDPQWSPDGRQIAYITIPTPRADDGSLSDIWVVDVASSKKRKLVENEGPDNSPRWSPDSRFIAYLSRDAKAGQLGQSNLLVIPAEGGQSRHVASDLIYQPAAARWSADGSTLFFSSSVRTTTQFFSAAVAGGATKQMSGFKGVASAPTFSRDGSTVAFTRSDTQNPADVYVAKLPGMTDGVKLTDHNPQVRDLRLGKGEVIKWKGKDGMEIEGVLLYPAGYEQGKRYPTIALIHGGPAGVWTESFPGSWGNFGHVWAGRGWAVFYPNVRGSSGYGEKFLLSNVRDWGGGDFQDIQSGLDHLIARGVSDPEKLAQSGWSYGGYMTAWTITQTNRFKSAMVGAGLTNMFSMYSTNDLPRTLEGYFGDQPWNDLEAYNRASAMTFIKKARTPTLILHGAEDKRVPVGQAQELYMGLLKNKVPVELVFYPRQGHGILEPRHQLDKMRREYAWHSRYVLGVEVPEPKPEKEEKKTEEKPSSK